MGVKANAKRGKRSARPPPSQAQPAKSTTPTPTLSEGSTDIDLRGLTDHEARECIAEIRKKAEYSPGEWLLTEASHARIACALSDFLRPNSRLKISLADSTTQLNANAIHRLSSRLPPNDPRRDRCYMEAFAYTMDQCIWAMDDPYSISQEPWRGLKYSKTEREALEMVICFRYLAGWHGADKAERLRKTGEDTVTMLERMEGRLQEFLKGPGSKKDTDGRPLRPSVPVPVGYGVEVTITDPQLWQKSSARVGPKQEVWC